MVLVSLPPWGLRVPSLAVGYLAESLGRHRWPVKVFDANLDLYDFVGEPKAEDLWVRDPLQWLPPRYEREVTPWIRPRLRLLVDEVLAAHPLVLGISVGTIFGRSVAAEFLAEVRRLAPDTFIVGGGNAMFSMRDRAWFGKDTFDCIVVGEAEESIVQIVERVAQGRIAAADLADIAGVVPWRLADGDPYARYTKREPASDLSVLPFPKYEEIDLDRYAHVNLLMSRGCPRTCQFCDNNARQGCYRRIPAELAFESMAYHYERGRRRFEFADVILNGDPRNFERLVDLILEAGWDVEWTGSVTTSKQMTPALLHKLHRAGVRQLRYGVESFSDEVLRRMHKGPEAELSQEVLRRTREAGIKAHMFLIAGFPGETEERFQQTVGVVDAHGGSLADSIAVSACMIPDLAPISVDSERFGVRRTGALPLVTWQGEHGNTHEERTDRIYRMSALLRSQGLQQTAGEGVAEVNCVLVRLPGQAPSPSSDVDPWTAIERRCRDEGLLLRVVDLDRALANAVCEHPGSRLDVERLSSFLADLLADFDRSHPLLPRSVEQSLDSILCAQAPCVLLWFPDQSDARAERFVDALHRTHPTLLVLAAGPGAASSTAVDGVLQADVSSELRALIRAYRVGRQPSEEFPGGGRLKSGRAHLLPWWVPVAELATTTCAPVADDVEKLELEVVFHRPSVPLRFRLVYGSHILWAIAGRTVHADAVMPDQRVPAGMRLTLEATLPRWFLNMPRKWLQLQAWEKRGQGQESEVLRALPVLEAWTHEEPVGITFTDLSARARSELSSRPPESTTETAPSLRILSRARSPQPPSVAHLDEGQVRWPVCEFHTAKSDSPAPAREEGRPAVPGERKAKTANRGDDGRGPLTQRLASRVALLRQIVARLEDAPRSPLPGWRLEAFEADPEGDVIARIALTRAQMRIQLEVLPGDATSPSFAETPLLKLRFARGSASVDDETARGVQQLCTLMDHYLRRDAR